MRVTHTLTFAGRCPVDNRQDVYECVVECDRVLKVEDIWAAVMRATERPEYQETITERIAEDLGCKVTTRGRHSNVDTAVASGQAEDAYERGRR